MLLAALCALAPSAFASGGNLARTWGINRNDELGIGTGEGPQTCILGESCATSPQQAVGVSGVTAVAAGAFHMLAIGPGGDVFAWGFNGNGQLGDGTIEETATPVGVTGISEAVQVAAGHEYSLALLRNGTVMAWGENDFGQLGDGNTTNSRVPVPVSGLSGVTAIAAGANHALALLSSGAVMAWGDNATGQLGDGNTTNSDVPVRVSTITTATSIAAGRNFSLARLAAGTIEAWGEGGAGEIGNGRFANKTSPIQVGGISKASTVAAGGAHGLALLSTGTVMAWGEGLQGELGNGADANSATPVAVSGLSGVRAIAAGYFHSLALLPGGTVWSWGYNGNGQLGDGNTESSSLPLQVPGLLGIEGIAGSQYDSVAYGPPPPAVSGLSPTAGSTNGRSPVTITGTEFTGASQVTFGASPAESFTVLSPTTIRALTPPGSETVDVSVTTPAGTSAAMPADRYSYVLRGPAPSVSGLSPAAGAEAGATSVRISGSAFSEATAVEFGSVPATHFTVESDSAIEAVSPPGSGTVDVTVTGPGGLSADVAADRFAFLSAGPPPAITGLSPKKGPSPGGTTVIISGSNLGLTSAVSFGGIPASSFEVLSQTKVSAASPPSTSGAAAVRVTTPAGTSQEGSKDVFTYGIPVVTSISPSSGPRAGGTTVSVSGSGFALGALTAFKIGKYAATSVECPSTESCTIVTGASLKRGPANLRATVGKAASANSAASLFTYE